MPKDSGYEAPSIRGVGAALGRWVPRRWLRVSRPALVLLVYSVGFVVLDVATQGLKGTMNFSLWFPPVGLTFALLLVFGARYAPAVALVFLLHLILFRGGLDYPVMLLFAIPVCYAVLYAGAAILLVRGLKIDPRLARVRDVAWFVAVACFLAPFLAGIEVVSGAVLAGYVSSDAFWGDLLGFWTGDATGIAVLTPFLLVVSRPFASLWAHRPRVPDEGAGFRSRSRRDLSEAGLQLLALVLSLAVAYGSARGASFDYAYIAFAPLVWVALRGGFERVTVAVLLINVGVVVLVGGESGGANPTLLQFGLMAMTLVGLLLGGQATERERGEEALEESERRFRSVVQNSSEAITILDPDGTARYASPAFERLFGYEPEEIVGKNINYHIHPEDLPRVEKALDEPGMARNVVEYRFRHKDGTWRQVESAGTYLVDDPAGRGVVVNARDVTERKEAEAALEENHALLRAVMEGTTDAVFVKDLQGRYLTINQAGAEALGRSVEEVIGKDDAELFSAEDGREVMEEDREIMASGETRTTEDTKTAEGVTRTYLVTRGPYRDGRGDVVGLFGISRDITERKRAEEALRESEERFRHVFEDAPIGVALVDLDGRRIRVNRAYCEMLGYPEEELLGKDYLEDIHPEDREISSKYFHQALEEGAGSYSLERRYVRADGRVVWSLTSASKIRGPGGDPSHFVCLHQDVTERKALEERLEHQAFHDSLTGLPNRALLLDRLGHALARADRQGGVSAVLFMDLDNFKLINDSLGHEAGDELLVGVAGRLKACLRPGDTAARLGGDEFAVLLEGVGGASGATRVAERITEELKAPFVLGGHELFASASIGVAVSGPERDRPGDLLRNADLAMYRAKEDGKARHAVFEETMNARALERLRLEGDLRRALRGDEFVVHYQPKVLLQTEKIVGFEALVRWEHPERGFVPPDEFIPAAEEAGLIVPLGRWVLERACRKARAWQERYPSDPPLMVCVNLSGRQLQHPGLAEDVARVLEETRLEAGTLELEITESVAMEDAESSVLRLEELKDLGVKLVVDDFGTGYSSFSYLNRFPVDFLKIDRSFVGRLGQEPGDEALVSGVIGLAHALGLEAIAEGVESAEQLARLKDLGCDMAQGYHFSEPLEEGAAEALLAENRQREERARRTRR